MKTRRGNRLAPACVDSVRLSAVGFKRKGQPLMSHMPVKESLNICDMSSAINSVELYHRRSLLSLFTQSSAPKLTADERKTNQGYGLFS